MKTFRSRQDFWNWQIQKLLKGDMLNASGLSRDEFTDHLGLLKGAFLNSDGERDMIIVPPSIVSLTAKMRLVTLKRKRGYCYIRPWEIQKEILTPANFYLALDVEDGQKMLGKSADRCVELFHQKRRSELVANEGAMIAYYWPEVLLDRNIDLPGSRHGADLVADLWLNEGRPELSWDGSGNSHSGWGSASCGSRVGL